MRCFWLITTICCTEHVGKNSYVHCDSILLVYYLIAKKTYPKPKAGPHMNGTINANPHLMYKWDRKLPQMTIGYETE